MSPDGSDPRGPQPGPLTTGRAMPIDVHVSLIGRTKLTDEIYRQLRSAILEGRLRGGERLPPTRELARQLSVSRTTVMDVYDRLLSEGFTESRIGAGTFVCVGLARLPGRTSPATGALRPRPLWEAIPQPRIFHRSAEFDFRAGIPDARLFPFDSWRRLQSKEWRRSAMGKGAYADAAGDPGLRDAIAQHVAIARGVRAGAADVIVTNGTQQAVDIIARALLSPGDLVAVEDPGYTPARWLFSSLGARTRWGPGRRGGAGGRGHPRGH